MPPRVRTHKQQGVRCTTAIVFPTGRRAVHDRLRVACTSRALLASCVCERNLRERARARGIVSRCRAPFFKPDICERDRDAGVRCRLRRQRTTGPPRRRPCRLPSRVCCWHSKRRAESFAVREPKRDRDCCVLRDSGCVGQCVMESLPSFR